MDRLAENLRPTPSILHRRSAVAKAGARNRTAPAPCQATQQRSPGECQRPQIVVWVQPRPFRRNPAGRRSSNPRRERIPQRQGPRPIPASIAGRRLITSRSGSVLKRSSAQLASQGPMPSSPRSVFPQARRRHRALKEFILPILPSTQLDRQLRLQKTEARERRHICP